ncbi:MAG: hypothetical protein SF052_04305 [Bacteroidia bacterium]|nr:hypothetical protein [Bacteroidia bacterium]
MLSKHTHTGYFFDQPPGPDFAPYERSATIFKSYTYDPRGRLLRVEQKTEDPDNPGHETDFTTLSEHRYDVLGQMTGKNLGYESGSQFLQIGDYQYNIRRWLSKFNQPSTATPGGTYRDLLAFELHYNTGASAIVSGTPNLFNGNISAMQLSAAKSARQMASPRRRQRNPRLCFHL